MKNDTFSKFFRSFLLFSDFYHEVGAHFEHHFTGNHGTLVFNHALHKLFLKGHLFHRPKVPLNVGIFAHFSPIFWASKRVVYFFEVSFKKNIPKFENTG